MLFIKAAQYLIAQIKQHLVSSLKIDLDHISVEQALAEKLQINIQTRIHRIDESLREEKKENKADKEKSGSAASSQNSQGQDAQEKGTEKENKEDKEKSGSAASSQNSQGQGAQEKGSEKDKQDDVNKLAQDVSNLQLGQPVQSPQNLLPNVQKQDPQLKDFAEHANEKHTPTDDLKLRLVGSKGALTWKEFVLSTEDDFAGHLTNDLKMESTTDQKLFILIRFSRQLEELCAKAEKELLAKESGQGSIKCVDSSLLELIQLRAEEAIRLCEKALDGSEQTYEIPYMPKISVKYKPGNTEVILFACKKMLEDFFEFCKEENIKRKVELIDSTGSMLDVFAAKIKNFTDPLMMIDHKACQYLFENLYIEAQYRGYLKYNLLPLTWKTYDSEVAKIKREKIQSSLVVFYQIQGTKTNDYEGLLSETDRLEKDLERLTPTLAYYWGSEQKSVTFCKELHTVLSQQASTLDPIAHSKHRNCYK